MGGALLCLNLVGCALVGTPNSTWATSLPAVVYGQGGSSKIVENPTYQEREVGSVLTFDQQTSATPRQSYGVAQGFIPLERTISRKMTCSGCSLWHPCIFRLDGEADAKMWGDAFLIMLFSDPEDAGDGVNLFADLGVSPSWHARARELLTTRFGPTSKEDARQILGALANAFSRVLDRRQIELRANVVGFTRSPTGDYGVEIMGLSPHMRSTRKIYDFRVNFRNRLVVPSEVSHRLKLGSVISLRGEFMTSIESGELCSKCHGKGVRFRWVNMQELYGTPVPKPEYLPVTCELCGGAGAILELSNPWDPRDTSDPLRWVIGYVQFRQTAYWLCFHLRNLEIAAGAW